MVQIRSCEVSARVDAVFLGAVGQLLEKGREGEQPGDAEPPEVLEVDRDHADTTGHDRAPDPPVALVHQRAGDDPVVHDRHVDDVVGPETVGGKGPGRMLDRRFVVGGREEGGLRARSDVGPDDLGPVDAEQVAVRRALGLVGDDVRLADDRQPAQRIGVGEVVRRQPAVVEPLADQRRCGNRSPGVTAQAARSCGLSRRPGSSVSRSPFQYSVTWPSPWSRYAIIRSIRRLRPPGGPAMRSWPASRRRG